MSPPSALSTIGDGVDVLQGGGNDQLYGSAGAGWISGGPGSDMLSGGPGTDGFVLRGDEGQDIISDFEDGDHLVFRDAGVQGPAEVDVTETNGNAVVGFDANRVTLRSIPAADIQNEQNHTLSHSAFLPEGDTGAVPVG